MIPFLLPAELLPQLTARGYEHEWKHLDKGGERYLRVRIPDRTVMLIDEDYKRKAYVGTLLDVYAAELCSSIVVLEAFIQALYNEHPERHYVFPE